MLLCPSTPAEARYTRSTIAFLLIDTNQGSITRNPGHVFQTAPLAKGDGSF
ncbi:hypothetical protein ASAP_0771 [Asaia bogorensis]|uniref:Uncharacterized protein n=1 Tax=Asaia bogorensis TaxID=91915 RepID=A0A060QHU3_9PROT|nr:hypothetical protein ASAP_0771 [Asaia bogorensis]